MGTTMMSLRTGDQLETLAHSFVDVPNTGEMIVDKNPNRRYLIVVNDSSSVVYLACNKPAKDNEGIRINQEGGFWEMIVPMGCQVYAKHNKSGTKRLLITEGW